MYLRTRQFHIFQPKFPIPNNRLGFPCCLQLRWKINNHLPILTFLNPFHLFIFEQTCSGKSSLVFISSSTTTTVSLQLSLFALEAMARTNASTRNGFPSPVQQVISSSIAVRNASTNAGAWHFLPSSFSRLIYFSPHLGFSV